MALRWKGYKEEMRRPHGCKVCVAVNLKENGVCVKAVFCNCMAGLKAINKDMGFATMTFVVRKFYVVCLYVHQFVMEMMCNMTFKLW